MLSSIVGDGLHALPYEYNVTDVYYFILRFQD